MIARHATPSHINDQLAGILLGLCCKRIPNWTKCAFLDIAEFADQQNSKPYGYALFLCCVVLRSNSHAGMTKETGGSE